MTRDYRHEIRVALMALDEETLREEIGRILESMEEDEEADNIHETEMEACARRRFFERAAAIAPSLDWRMTSTSEAWAVLVSPESYVWVQPGAVGMTCGGLEWRWPVTGKRSIPREPQDVARAMARRARRYLARVEGRTYSLSYTQTMSLRKSAVRRLFEATRWALPHTEATRPLQLGLHPTGVGGEG